MLQLYDLVYTQRLVFKISSQYLFLCSFSRLMGILGLFRPVCISSELRWFSYLPFLTNCKLFYICFCTSLKNCVIFITSFRQENFQRKMSILFSQKIMRHFYEILNLKWDIDGDLDTWAKKWKHSIFALKYLRQI